MLQSVRVSNTCCRKRWLVPRYHSSCHRLMPSASVVESLSSCCETRHHERQTLWCNTSTFPSCIRRRAWPNAWKSTFNTTSNYSSHPRRQRIHTHTAKTSQIITYLTDVEGDAAYLDRFVRISKVLEYRPIQPRFHPNNTTTTEAPTLESNFSSCHFFPYDHCLDFILQDNSDSDPSSMLIYGGDIWDKGGSDLYVIRQLLDLKRRYPDRVHFIMGNRDINKMRIPQEMGLEDVAPGGNTPPPEDPLLPHHEGVYWLRNFHEASGGDPSDDSIAPPQRSASDRLKWMLERTMGSPKAFELRRLELQREKRAAVGYDSDMDTSDSHQREGALGNLAVTDDEVVKSYRQSCHPHTGEIGNYLANAHLALRIGELLVVHGALPLTKPVLEEVMVEKKKTAVSGSNASYSSFWKDMTFAMPWKQQLTTGKDNTNNIGLGSGKGATTTARESIDSWILNLNDFAERSLDAWKASSTREEGKPQKDNSDDIWALHGGYQSSMPEGQLMQYGMGWTPDGKRNPTIVYSSWGDDGMPKRFFPPDGSSEDRKEENELYVKLVQDFFRQSGLRLILAGHQPQGDMPLPIRIECDEHGLSDAKMATTTTTTTKENTLGWVLCCDTSYSGDTQWVDSESSQSSGVRVNLGRGTGPGFRGDFAVSETLVEIDEKGNVLNVYWHGILNDGTAFQSSPLPLTKNEEDNTGLGFEAIGTVAQGHWVPKEHETPHETKWWTKAHLDDRSTLLTTARGYEVHNCLVDWTNK